MIVDDRHYGREESLEQLYADRVVINELNRRIADLQAKIARKDAANNDLTLKVFTATLFIQSPDLFWRMLNDHQMRQLCSEDMIEIIVRNMGGIRQ